MGVHGGGEPLAGQFRHLFGEDPVSGNEHHFGEPGGQILVHDFEELEVCSVFSSSWEDSLRLPGGVHVGHCGDISGHDDDVAIDRLDPVVNHSATPAGLCRGLDWSSIEVLNIDEDETSRVHGGFSFLCRVHSVVLKVRLVHRHKARQPYLCTRLRLIDKSAVLSI